MAKGYTGPIKTKKTKKAGFGGIVATQKSDFQMALNHEPVGIFGTRKTKAHSTVHKALKGRKKPSKCWTGGF